MYSRGAKTRRLTNTLCTGIFGVFFFTAHLAAESITGMVHNLTNDGPAAGDEVILLEAGQSTQEEARRKTDAQGAFTFDVRHSGEQYLLRVIHQGVNYDRHVSVTSSNLIDVADATAKAKGITGGIEIIRAGTRGNLLHVSDMVEIRNSSSPPVTQAAERTFEVYLPANAKLDSVLAAGPDNIGVMIKATPLRGEPGHYAVDFPLRPGATKFAFNYDLRYDGRVKFRTKTVVSLQQLAVMIPPTMIFSSPSSAFRVLPVGNTRYTVEAAEQLAAGEGREFELSGAGEFPPAQAAAHPLPRPSSGSAVDPSPAKSKSLEAHLPNPSAAGEQPPAKLAARFSRVQWWAPVVTLPLIVAAFWGLLLRKGRHRHRAAPRTSDGMEHAGSVSPDLVEALKEGLLQLESDRLQGLIAKEEYASARQALDRTIEWAVARSQVDSGVTTV